MKPKYDCLMDGETIRLIVVALGAITAGLSGALIAGAFNSQNTQATIEAARMAAEAQREADWDTEHRRWLRDRKTDAYVNFIEQLRDVDKKIREYRSGISSEGPLGVIQATRNVNALEVRLLAPDIVSAAGQEAMDALQVVIQNLGRSGDKAPDSDAYITASEAFVRKMNKLEGLIREDLEVPHKGTN